MMSNKEKLLQMVQELDDSQLAPIIAMAEIYLKGLEEALDDAFCKKLLMEAKADPDKETIPLDDFVKELGFDVKDLQN